jgi:hypothetical protein
VIHYLMISLRICSCYFIVSVKNIRRSILEAFHGKCDTLSRSTITETNKKWCYYRLFSLIFRLSYSNLYLKIRNLSIPDDDYSHATLILAPGIILGLRQKWVKRLRAQAPLLDDITHYSWKYMIRWRDYSNR